MKIEDVTCHLCSFPYPKNYDWTLGYGRAVKRDTIVVKVITDEGIVGVGEPYHGFAPKPIEAAVMHVLKPVVLGRDPAEINRLWDEMMRASVQLGATGVAAISGLETALWDIIGKQAGLPVYKLLGGGGTTRIPAYVGSHCLGWKERVEDLVDEARGYVEQGYRALKLRAGRSLDYDVAIVRAVRETFPEVAIAIDVNSAYTPLQAVALAEKLRPFDLLWLEDPYDYTVLYHHGDMARLAREVQVPIATGGNLYTRFQLRNLIEVGGVDIVTPDVAKSGGIGECVRMGALASAWNLQVAPHVTAGLNMVASLHMAAALPQHNFLYLEWDPGWYNPPRDDLFAPRIRFDDGYLLLPDGPGLGVTVNDEVLTKNPYIPGGEIGIGRYA